VVAVGNDEQFARLRIALGLPELATDDRFTANALRIERRTTLADLLAARIATCPRAVLGEHTLEVLAGELDRLRREGAISVG